MIERAAADPGSRRPEHFRGDQREHHRQPEFPDASQVSLVAQAGVAEAGAALRQGRAGAMAALERLDVRLGDSGAGQLTKMVNQICIAGTVQGLAEALHFALATGQDAPAVLEVISKGAAQSWQMDNRGATMLAGEFDFGFAVDWMRKDLDIVLDAAREAGAHLPVTALGQGENEPAVRDRLAHADRRHSGP